MSSELIFIVGISFPGAIWRAVFVALLALILFVLARYWLSLADYSKTTRYLLIGLRAGSLILVACLLSGLSIEYNSQLPLRILVQQVGKVQSSTPQDSNYSPTKVLSSLSRNEIELVDVTNLDTKFTGTSKPQADAAIAVIESDVSPSMAKDQVERLSSLTSGPVFIVKSLTGDTMPRVSLVSATVADGAVRGVPVTVQCVLHARRMRGRTTLVTISDEAQVRTSTQVSWSQEDEQQFVTLEVVPKTAGWLNYVVRAEAGGREDPATLSRSFSIYAEDRRARVLIIEGEPTWETKFIRRALDSAELFDVDYYAQVSKEAVAGVKERQAEPGAGTTETKERSDAVSPVAGLRAALSSASRLNTYECVILSTTPDTFLSNAEAARLRDWVERRGGGLIILGGNNFSGSIVSPKGKLAALMPAEINSSGLQSDSQAVARNTPVEADKQREGIQLTPTELGQAGPLRGYSDAMPATANSGLLSGTGFRLGALRAGADVLAVSGAANEKGTSEEGAPLIAAMRYGGGRSVVFAPSDSWRMKTGETNEEADESSAFASLWQGLTLWASSLATPPVDIVMNHNSPQVLNETIVEVRVRNAEFVPTAIERLSASFQSVNDAVDGASAVGTIQVIEFAPDVDDASVWRGRLIAPEAGHYRIQIRYVSNGTSGTIEKHFATVPVTPVDPDEIRDTLNRLARQNGGDVVMASDLKALESKLRSLKTKDQSVRKAWELRTWWPFALLIPLLMSIEWLIRRIKLRNYSAHALS